MPANKRTYSLVGLLFTFFVLFPKPIYSYSSGFFTDNLINSANWQVYANSGSIASSGGIISLLRSDAQSSSFPYIYTKDDVFPSSGPFSIEIKFRFLDTGNFGDGITISPGDVPANGTNPDDNLFNFMIFMIYQDKTNGLSYGKFLCDQSGLNCNQRTFLDSFSHVSDLNFHKVNIVFNEQSQYLIYIDDDTAPKFVSGINQRRPKKIWAGNSFMTGSVDYWSSLEIDYIKVNPLTVSNPVVIIPGIAGSWDMGAFIKGSPGGNWKVPWFVKNYDSLIKSFENAGYEQDVDLHVYSYDWRRPISEQIDNFAEFVDDKIDSGEKMNIVGHSMGGLIARGYAQEYGLDKVNKVITAGSPHLGSLEAYNLWEGAVPLKDIWWEKAGPELAAFHGWHNGESRIESVRTEIPSLKDLLPVYDFLSFDGVLKPWSTLNQINSFLPGLNSNFSIVDSKLSAIVGNGISTATMINAIEPSEQDEENGLWVDGKPRSEDPYAYRDGDDTVSTASAGYLFSNQIVFPSYHYDMIDTQAGIEKVFEILDLDESKIEILPSSVKDKAKKVLIGILNSPGKLEICNLQNICDNELGINDEENKVFMLPGYDGEKLIAKVRENGELGNYSLSFGNIGDLADWTEETGELVEEGQIDYYIINSEDNGISVEIDSEGPVITINLPIDLAHYTLGSAITANWTADDAISGVVNATGEVPSGELVDTHKLGHHEFQVYAIDAAGNESTKKVSYVVDPYILGEFQAPTKIDSKTFKTNSSIPIKIKLFDVNGHLVTNASITLKVDGLNAMPSGGSNKGNYFKFDPLSGQYIYNLSTKLNNLVPGKHELSAHLNDGSIYKAWMTVR